MKYPCMIKEQPSQPVLSIRTRTSIQNLSQAIGSAYGKIMPYLNQLGEQPGGVPFVAYFNMDMQDLDIEIGFPVSHELPGQGEVLAGTIPAGKAATCVYVGPYEGMKEVYAGLDQWMKENQCQPTGVVYEFYYNSPMDTPPDQLKTEIVFPLVG
jgi:effector-binding domain-containing protein